MKINTIIDIKKVYYLTSATASKNKFIIVDQAVPDEMYSDKCRQWTVPESMTGLYGYKLQNQQGVPYQEIFNDQMKIKTLYSTDKKYQQLLEYLRTRVTQVYVRGGLG